MSEHPDFLAVKPSHRWTGSLIDLLVNLRHEAYRIGAASNEAMREADKDWAWRVLPRGAFVGIRMRPDLAGMRREMRISRNEPLRDPPKFEVEVQTFLTKFRLQELDGRTPATERATFVVRIPNTPRDAGKSVVRLVELLTGEVRPGVARCHRCHCAGRYVEVEYRAADAIVGQHCIEHAGFSLDDRERAKAGAP